jgi:hypothetical protein
MLNPFYWFMFTAEAVFDVWIGPIMQPQPKTLAQFPTHGYKEKQDRKASR